MTRIRVWFWNRAGIAARAIGDQFERAWTGLYGLSGNFDARADAIELASWRNRRYPEMGFRKYRDG